MPRLRSLAAAAVLAASITTLTTLAAAPPPVHAHGRPAPRANRPPEFEQPPYHQVAPGRAIAFGLHVIDQDGDAVTVELVAKPAGAAYDPVTLTVNWKPTAADAPAGHFRVRVTETLRAGGAPRKYLHDFAIAVVPGSRELNEPPPLGAAVELLITIHDRERLARVNRDFPFLKLLEAVGRLEHTKLPEAERAAVRPPDAKQLYNDALTALALRHGNDRLDPASPRFDKRAYGDPAAWRITAVRPRLDKAVRELRIVFENLRAPEPVYLMFRFRLVRDQPELPPEAVALNNRELVRLTHEAFFRGPDLDARFLRDKQAHGAAVSAYVGKVLAYTSTAHPLVGAEFVALPHEARLGGGSRRGAGGGYESGDGWAWAVLKAKWLPVAGDKDGAQKRLAMVSVPIPGFTTEVRASADGARWQTVCAKQFDPDDPAHTPGQEVLCRKKLGFTDLPAVGEAGKIVPGAIDAANLYVDHKRGDMVATVPLTDPRRDLFEENGMSCHQCHVRDFANGDLRNAAARDPRVSGAWLAGAPLPTTFFNIVPEETWRPFMIEFQRLQECQFRQAFKDDLGVETSLVCPHVAE
ncbi:MAG: hypothetical protein EXR73_09380 [Myxococcales bacterium]|nr:hypothetical protein [Myxococcales bacterium]